MVLRIDNAFFNTPDVLSLANFYQLSTGYPIRRIQDEGSAPMWAEISVGGMELSFRRAEDTAKIHPQLAGKFIEVQPGQGATISFEVSDTDVERRRLEQIGAVLHGDPIVCNGGQEIITVFSDPSGRPVQLYEPRFSSAETAAAAGRGSSASALSEREILPGSNLRGVSGLGYSAAMVEDDLNAARHFYADLLELNPIANDPDHVAFDLDNAVIELRAKASDAGRGLRLPGVIPLLEVGHLDRALRFQPATALAASRTKNANIPARHGPRARLADSAGNPYEIWQRTLG